jgi:hypothetical protein
MNSSRPDLCQGPRNYILLLDLLPPQNGKHLHDSVGRLDLAGYLDPTSYPLSGQPPPVSQVLGNLRLDVGGKTAVAPGNLENGTLPVIAEPSPPQVREAKTFHEPA